MWNYRLIRSREGDEWVLGLYEVIYNEDGTIFGHTEKPILGGFSDLDDIKDTLNYMISDVEKVISGEKEILTENEIEFITPDFDKEELEEYKLE